MARDLGERLLAALRRVEQLYQGSAVSAASAEGGPTNAPRSRAGEADGGDVQALENDVPMATGEEDFSVWPGPALLAGRHEDHSRPRGGTSPCGHNRDRSRPLLPGPALAVHRGAASAADQVPAGYRRYRDDRAGSAGPRHPPGVDPGGLGAGPGRRLPARAAVGGAAATDRCPRHHPRPGRATGTSRLCRVSARVVGPRAELLPGDCACCGGGVGGGGDDDGGDDAQRPPNCAAPQALPLRPVRHLPRRAC
jgi:hypothetical protein